MDAPPSLLQIGLHVPEGVLFGPLEHARLESQIWPREKECKGGQGGKVGHQVQPRGGRLGGRV